MHPPAPEPTSQRETRTPRLAPSAARRRSRRMGIAMMLLSLGAALKAQAADAVQPAPTVPAPVAHAAAAVPPMRQASDAAGDADGGATGRNALAVAVALALLGGACLPWRA
ncbi:hypothetical protein [Coralloluteibacterium thermophilus]|uniref:Uncharacterized protein n=1 Tax=Coralloluteibacterium thermophilum TaxID=2707049 RepID=A0ABV9NI77_9GAMM